MSSWGGSDLQIVVGSIKAGGSATLGETPILPNPASLSTVSTILQQQGRKRRRAGAKLYADNISDYNSYKSAMDACTTGTLSIDPAGVSGTYLVESVGDPEFVQWDMIFFDVTWLEV
jgi:hypothetical protein